MQEKNRATSHDYIKPDIIHYSNCWEDTHVLLDALQLKKGGIYLSIASSGDNTLAILTKNPSLVLAVDASPAQIACLEIRKALFLHLPYEAVLKFLGVNDSTDRLSIYNKIRIHMSAESRAFWDKHLNYIHQGIIHAGKFENYFRVFRSRILPLILSQKNCTELLKEKTEVERIEFYNKKLNSWRWRILFKIFFSRMIMGHLGRQKEFFKYVKGNVAYHILQRTKYALTVLPTHNNPYLEYIVKGNFVNTLPLYLQKENFLKIRNNLDKLIIFKGYLSEALQVNKELTFDGSNLSDIFEYMNYDQYVTELQNIINSSKQGARMVYWNMMVTRTSPDSLRDRLKPLEKIAGKLLLQNRAFFYQSLVIEEVQ